MKTSCNGKCEYDGTKCVSCNRTGEDISNWRNYSPEQRQKIIDDSKIECYHEMSYPHRKLNSKLIISRCKICGYEEIIK
jgi:predicted Fe-S protein YdhL (DUF1289 family)